MKGLKSDISITGISGRFPESANVEEFKRNLFEGVDMVTADNRRWPLGYLGLPERLGKLKDLKSFDASYFGIHAKQAHVMDPQLRILLEVVQEAIIDSGINPSEIRGSNTGVYIGVGLSETDEYFSADPEKINGYGIIGCCRAMFANRISYSFDFTGPSIAVDTGCSSSAYALHQAVSAMRAGECDSAIVGGVTLILKPNTSLHFLRLNVLSTDGKCRSFDANGKGYVRAETICAIFLQRAQDAKRIYATILNTRTNVDGHKNLGITYPCGQMQLKLLKEVYAEAKVDPREISYVEAHGTGTKAGDPQELNAIADFFCKDRSSPLLIGSVKSNMGHSESASGLCSVAKILLSMESKKLPGNLHYETPNPNIPALVDGRLKVVDQQTSWEGGLVGLNSVGFGGANAHVILKSFSKENPPTACINIPKIVGVSGRTREACKVILEAASKHKRDDEFIGLIHNVNKTKISGYNYRGYSILKNEVIQEIDECENPSKRPVWFVCTGLGTQWPGMGKELMKIRKFAESIERSASYVRSFGINLLDLIDNSTEKDFDNIITSFVMTTSIQVALIDLLASLGVHPDGFVGLSAGEMACAYADGGLTQEQTILSTYWRGRSVIDCDIIDGDMVAIGLSWEETVKSIPKDIDITCHTALYSNTIAGPIESIGKFVNELTSKNIFAKYVNVSNIPFHSRYMTKAGPKLKASMKTIITNPKLRSSKWISSSVPESSWGTESDKYCNADYFVNNLLQPVYFVETHKYIPDNAITIEIAPTSTMRSVFRKSLAPTTLNVALHKNGYPDNNEFLMSNLGKLFNAGVDIDFSKLYPPIEFPVSSATPILSALVGWDHSQQWAVADFSKNNANSGETIINLNLAKEEDKYLAGHKVDGRIVFPAAGYLVLVWKTFAKILGAQFDQLPVVFNDVNLLRISILPKEGSLKLLINIFRGTRDFEICEGNSLVVTGKIRILDIGENHQLVLPDPDKNTQEYLDLTAEDVYTDLRLRGTEYTGIFKGIKSVNNILSEGELYWKDNWISFVESLIQVKLVIQHETKDTFLPTRIQYLSIDPQKHLSMKNDENIYKVNSYSDLNIVKSGGVEIRGLKFSLAMKRKQDQASPKLENYLFIPYHNQTILDSDPSECQLHALSVLFQIVKENLQVMKLRGVEVCSNIDNLLAPTVVDILLNEPLITLNFGVASVSSVDLSTLVQFDVNEVNKDISLTPVGQDLHFIIAENVISKNNSTVLTNLIRSIKPEGFILLIETGDFDLTFLDNFRLIAASIQSYFGKSYVLLKRKAKKINPIVIEITKKNFSWLEKFKAALRKSKVDGDKILLVSQGEPELGLVGLMTCVRRDSEIGNNVYYIFIQDEKVPKFSLENPFYKSQLEKQIMSNVLKGNKWGSYRHLRVKDNKLTSTVEANHAYVNTLAQGDFSSLRWIERPLQYEKLDKNLNKEICNVYYAPLNFRDVILATEKLSPDALRGDLLGEECILGLEFAGRDSRGQRVMGIVPEKGLATTVLGDKNGFLWNVPEKWTLEEASTIPVCYSTGYYALFIRGKLQPGESVLIHAGSGGVGLASISIALHAGCKVFTTVSTNEKREFLKKTFAQLSDKCIGNSRDTSFEQMINQETNGAGVDVVLNSLSEEKLKASIRCLRKGGRFLEIGKFNLCNDSPLGMSVFLKNTSFHGILLDALFEEQFSAERQQIVEMLSEGIASDAVKPLPCTVFNKHQLEQGFRFIALGKHIGKVVLKIRNEEDSKNIPAAPQKISATPRTYFNPEKSYILVGGLGGFGMELANWMIDRGVKFLILTSRSGIKTGYQSLWMRRWQQLGACVSILTEDVTKMSECTKVIEVAKKLAPVGGIYNLAAVTHDDIIENLNEHIFSIVLRPKVDATKNLDIVSRKLCPSIDHFVVFSSVTCGRGLQGQTNYGLANSAMERLVEKRREQGLPGLAIQWGAIGDVGLFINTIGDNNTAVGGTLPQRIYSCLNVMDILLQKPDHFCSVVSSIVLEDKIKFKKDKCGQTTLVDVIANIMGIKDVNTINQKATFLDLGLDSLITTEVQQTLERTYDIVMTVPAISVLTFVNLKEISAKNTEDGENPEEKTDDSNIKEISTVEENLVILTDTELAPKEVVVLLNPQNKCSSDPVFFIHVPYMKNIAMKINRRAYGLQCTNDVPFETTRDLSRYFMEKMIKLQPQGPYTIIAYSFGTMLALEIASILETSGEKAIIKLIDGSPDLVLKLTESIDNYFKSKTDFSDDLKRKCFAFFSKKINPKVNFIELFEAMKDLQEEEMLDKLVKYVGNSQLQPEDIKIAALISYKKRLAITKCQSIRKVFAPVLLIKASDNFMTENADYGLSKICAGDFEIKEIRGNHETIVSIQNIDTLVKHLNI